ncbi:MAG: DinB family protein [Saprospiraceae bacterium]|nr:DinB family protein [Saprospiraceae bacterium]
MKRLTNLALLLSILSLSTLASGQDMLSKDDRNKAITSLKSSSAMLLESVKGLSPSQLNYKADPESWSIAECVEHLAISEKNIFGLVDMALQSPSDPSLRASLPFSDEEVVGFISDRSSKVKTQPPFEPKGNFGSFDGSLDEFKTLRKSNMKYIKKTKDDLRNHYFDFPFGKVDAYQVVMFMSGHTMRHTAQIKEVMTHDGFPTS